MCSSLHWTTQTHTTQALFGCVVLRVNQVLSEGGVRFEEDQCVVLSGLKCCLDLVVGLFFFFSLIFSIFVAQWSRVQFLFQWVV